MLKKNCISSDGLVIHTVRTHEDLEPHAEAWNHLAFQAPHRLPDLSHAWIASYLEYQLNPGESWVCLFAYDHSSLVGVLPVVVTPIKRMGMPCHKFRTPYNDHTASVDFLVKSGGEQEIIPFLLSQLTCLQPTCFSFEMRRLPESSPTLKLMNNGARRMNAVSVFDGYGSFVKIDRSFDEYKALLGTKYVRNLRRLERKLFTLPGANISFLTGDSLTEQELSRFMAVEACSWKYTEGSALCQCDSLVSFYKALTGRLTDLGWLEWHFLEAEGKTIAAHLALKINRSLIIFKICYDQAYSSYSPGAVLFEKMFERAFHSGDVDEVNLLTDYAWNQNWQAERRSYYNLYLFPDKPWSTLAGYVPLKMRVGFRQVPAVRQAYNFCLNCFKRVGLEKASKEMKRGDEEPISTRTRLD